MHTAFSNLEVLDGPRILWQLDQAADIGCSAHAADHMAAWMQTDGGGSIDLDAGSQEILALLSATSQSNISRQTSKLPAMLTSLPGSHKAPAVQKVCQSTLAVSCTQEKDTTVFLLFAAL